MSVNEHEMQIINDAFDMSRVEAIEQLEKAYKECIDLGQTCGKDSVFWKRAEAIKVAIKALEQEPKTGHWEQYGYPWEDKFKCSECGEKQPQILCGERIIGYWSDYCPNCGARMESEE